MNRSFLRSIAPPLLTLALSLSLARTELHGAITLMLSQPESLPCGDISINGYVGTSSGVILRMSWDWGDGATDDNWFPARHHYAADGSYTVAVTAFSSTGETLTKSVSATVTNATQTGCDHITLLLAAPEYLGCGDVSITGYVTTSVGQIQRMVWDWGDGTSTESWFPARHSYPDNGTYQVAVTAHSSAGETHTEGVSVAVTAIVPACSNTFRVYPPVVVLKDGRTSETLTLDLRDERGQPVGFDPRDATFTSSRPGLVQVDAAGRVSATGLGEARVEVRIAGQPRKAEVQVVAGEIRVEPAILLLSLEPYAAGQASLNAFSADGSAVSFAGRTVVFGGGNAVAAVDPQGSVTPSRPPLEFWESPYITASLDGMPARNACFVRVTEPELGLTMQDHAGAFVTFRVAQNVGPHPYGQLIEQLQVVPVMDTVFRLQQRLTGARPHQGGRQFFVMDPGFDGDSTVPCGLSGNPVRLGVGVDNLRSCLGGADWVQWGVIGHELAHDFLYHAALGAFLSGLNNSIAYSEGLTTAVSLYCFEDILNDPGRYGVAPGTVDSLRIPWVPLMPVNVRQQHYAALASYEADPQYATEFDADLMDAILLRLGDDHGPGFMFRLLSVFYPPDEVFMTYASETERLSFWVAACSAAAQADLRSRFREMWGYTIDDGYFEGILPLLEQRAGQRDPLIREVAVDAQRLRVLFHAVPDTVYTLECSSDLAQWVDLATGIAGGFTCELSDSTPLTVPHRFYRVRQHR